MPTNEYHFITRWRVEGTLEEVSDIIEDVEALPRWWPSVYLEVEVIEPGDPQGVGKLVGLCTKGWLPYTLRWQFRVTQSRYPHGSTLEALGDFLGRGIWTFEPDGPFVNITFDWKIRAAKPILRQLSFLFKPVFAANHRWAMSRGEESLKLELARRRTRTPEEAASLPPPPGPTWPHNKSRRKAQSS
jgi:hypothetical protein